jgi:hypothetical protein
MPGGSLKHLPSASDPNRSLCGRREDPAIPLGGSIVPANANCHFCLDAAVASSTTTS